MERERNMRHEEMAEDTEAGEERSLATRGPKAAPLGFEKVRE